MLSIKISKQNHSKNDFVKSYQERGVVRTKNQKLKLQKITVTAFEYF